MKNLRNCFNRMSIIKNTTAFILLLIFLIPISLPGSDPYVGISEKNGDYIPMDLKFTNSEGEVVQLKDIITKTTVLSLVYYHCPTVCKPLLGAKVDVMDRINLIPGKDYQAVTISFNDRETPENAKNIKENFLPGFKKNFPEDAWHFLTGDLETIKKFTDSVGFYFRRDGEDFIHPTGLIMLSPEGKITRYFNGIKFLPLDVKLGLLEASEGRIGATISKVLLYCFSYDPEGKRYVFNILKVTASISLFFGLIFITWLLVSTRRKRKGK